MTRMLRRALLTASALATTLACAACGSSSTPDVPAVAQTGAKSPTAATTTASAGPSHADFTDKLNTICRNANAKVHRIDSGGQTDYDSMAAVYAQVPAIFASAGARLDNLDVPAADAATFAQYRTSVTRSSGLSGRMAAALRAHDDEEISTLTDALTTERKHHLTAAVDLGADDCGH